MGSTGVCATGRRSIRHTAATSAPTTTAAARGTAAPRDPHGAGAWREWMEGGKGYNPRSVSLFDTLGSVWKTGQIIRSIFTNTFVGLRGRLTR